MKVPECTQIAHRRSLAIFHRRLEYRREFCSGHQLCPLNRRKNRHSLTISDRKEIVHHGLVSL